MSEKERARIDDDMLENVSGGTEILNHQTQSGNDDPLDAPHRLTWCAKCKKMVKYSEFTGGRYVCDICSSFVNA